MRRLDRKREKDRHTHTHKKGLRERERARQTDRQRGRVRVYFKDVIGNGVLYMSGEKAKILSFSLELKKKSILISKNF